MAFYGKVNAEQAKMLAETLDFDAVQDFANDLYGTTYKMDQTYMQEDWSGQANDPGRAGYIYCGSEYVGKALRRSEQFFIMFDALVEAGDLDPDHRARVKVEQFMKPNNKEEAVNAATSDTVETANLMKVVWLFVIVGISSRVTTTGPMFNATMTDPVKNFFFSGGRQTLRVENFSAARQQVLDTGDDDSVKCYLFQYMDGDNMRTFAMKRDGAWAELTGTNFVIRQDKFRK